MRSNERPDASGRRPKELTGRTVLICLVAFFAVVVGANAIMIRAAISTFGGVDTDNAYQAGLAFTREVAAVEAQDALHWQVEAKVSTSPEATLVEITAHDANNRPLSGLDATARLMHPTDQRADKVVPLDESMAGTFRGRGESVLGHWTLVTELSRNGTVMFRSRNRVFFSEKR